MEFLNLVHVKAMHDQENSKKKIINVSSAKIVKCNSETEKTKMNRYVLFHAISRKEQLKDKTSTMMKSHFSSHNHRKESHKSEKIELDILSHINLKQNTDKNKADSVKEVDKSFRHKSIKQVKKRNIFKSSLDQLNKKHDQNITYAARNNSNALVSMICTNCANTVRKILHEKAVPKSKFEVTIKNKNKMEKSKLLQNADRLLFKKRYEEAAFKYLIFIKQKRYYGLYIGLGTKYQRADNYEDNAGRWYSNFTKKYPDYDCAYNGLGIAISQLENQNLQQIEKQIDKLISMYNSSCELMYLKGVIHFNLKNFEEAKQYFSKSRQIRNNEGYQLLGLAHCERQLNNKQKSQQLYDEVIMKNQSSIVTSFALMNKYDLTQDKALKKYYATEASSINLSYTRPYFQLGKILNHNEQNFNEAIVYLKKAEEINNKLIGLNYQLGNSYRKLAKFQQAKVFLLKCLQINGEFEKAYIQLGNISISQKQFEKAIDYFDSCLNINPQFPQAYCSIAQAYKSMEDPQKASQLLRKCINKFPNFPGAYIDEAKLLIQLQNEDQAIQWLNKCIEVNCDCEITFYQAGKIFLELRQYDDSIQCFKKAAQINPDYYHSYHNIGDIYKKLKEYKKAIKWYEQCLKVNPNHYQSYFSLGQVNFLLKKYKQAIKQFKSCILVETKHHIAYHGIGLVYLEARKYQTAVHWFEKCIQINSEYHPTYVSLANSLVALERYEEAINNFDQALKINPNDPLIYLKKAQTLIQIENFKQSFNCFRICEEKLKYDSKLSNEDIQYIRQELQFFKAEREEWEHRVKIGFVTKQQIQRIKNMKRQFQEKFDTMKKDDNCFRGSISTISSKALPNYEHKFINICKILYTEKWNLENVCQIGELMYPIFQKDHQSFQVFAQILCNFFWIKKFVNGNESIIEIQAKLKQKVSYLAQNFKPTDDRQHISLTFPEKEGNKINLFQDSEYFSSYLGVVTQIEKVFDRAKKMSNKFFKLAYSTQKIAQASCCKTGLKLPEKNQDRFKVLIRIFEKMFKQISQAKQSIITQIEEKIDEEKKKSMADIVSIIVDVWIRKIDMILAQRQKQKIPTYCYLSDLVRGKCMFGTPEQVKQAYDFIIIECEKYGYEITEIENRMNKITHDVVFKINISDIICEFQLALETNESKYEFGHSFYEIERSPLGCIFGTYIILSKRTDYNYIQRCNDMIDTLKKKTDRVTKENIKAINYVIDILKLSSGSWIKQEQKNSNSKI